MNEGTKVSIVKSIIHIANYIVDPSKQGNRRVKSYLDQVEVIIRLIR